LFILLVMIAVCNRDVDSHWQWRFLPKTLSLNPLEFMQALHELSV